jgi:hypothetical protein
MNKGKRMRTYLLPIVALLAGGAAQAAELARITVTNDLDQAGPRKPSPFRGARSTARCRAR